MKFAIFTRDERFVFVEMDSTLVESFRAKYGKACDWRLINIDECKTQAEATRKAKKVVKELRGRWGKDITPTTRPKQACRLSGSEKQWLGLQRQYRPRGWQPKERRPQKCWYLEGKIKFNKTAMDYGCILGF